MEPKYCAQCGYQITESGIPAGFCSTECAELHTTIHDMEFNKLNKGATVKFKKVLLLAGLGLTILTGCERRAKDEPQRDPGSFMPSAPCVTRPDGTLNCSDAR